MPKSFFALILCFFNAMAVAQNYCPQVTESLAKTCKDKAADLCDVPDELLFQKLARYADRAHSTSQVLFEKYQSLLKGPATKTALKDLTALTEEASPCVTATHQLWTLLLRQASIKSSRKSLVQNLIRKKLLSADLYSFTLDSLRVRLFLIDDAIAYQLIEVSEAQKQSLKSVHQSLNESKALMTSISKAPSYSEKTQKVTNPAYTNTDHQAQFSQLGDLFTRVRASHQQINHIFQ